MRQDGKNRTLSDESAKLTWRGGSTKGLSFFIEPRSYQERMEGLTSSPFAAIGRASRAPTALFFHVEIALL